MLLTTDRNANGEESLVRAKVGAPLVHLDTTTDKAKQVSWLICSGLTVWKRRTKKRSTRVSGQRHSAPPEKKPIPTRATISVA